MKIRIIKKGLPKHQVKGQVELNQPIGTFFTPAGGYESLTWKPITEQAVPVPGYTKPPKLVQSAPTELTKTNPTIVPIKRFSKNEWMPANQDKLTFAVNKGIQGFQKFLNTKPMAVATNSAAGIMGMVDAALPFAQMWDTSKKNKAIERAYRETLLSQGPVDYTENRGDYEINTGMVDPYNTGAKSKGQFANAYYAPTMQDGGITLGPISFSDVPVFRNVYSESFAEDRPIAANRPAAAVREAAPTKATRSAAVNFDPSAFEDAAEFLKSVEGYTPKAKWDYAQHSIGYGTRAKSKDEVISKQEAEQRLQEELQPIMAGIQKKVKVPLTSGQLIALASINYNTGSLANRLINRLNQGEDPEIIANSIKSLALTGVGSNKVLPGLVKRRQKEAALFTRGYEMGGENPTDMKIRIVKTPATEMEYGGQLGYGFDLGGRRVYTDMPESMSETVSNTMGPVPEEMATIEAEKGETILSDVDGDGMKEHMTIGGKRHSEGGTPLAADPGDFVFSDTKKMKIKSPQLLKLFGKTAKSGGYTPAQIAKQYDINKYKAILQDPNSDSMSKKTAEMMISNYEKKLGMLSLVQEAKKGFPSGIPSVADSVMPEAKYGGYLEQYQDGGPKKMSKAEYEAAVKRGDFKTVGNRVAERIWKEKVKDAVPGQEAQYQTIQAKAPGKGSDAFNKAFAQARKAGLKEFTFNGKKYNTGVYVPGQGEKKLIKEAVPGTPEVWEERKEHITYDDPKVTEVPGIETTTGDTPYDWTQQDRNNLMLALTKRGRVQKFSSVRPDVNPVMPDFRNMDWRGRAAELQGTYNSQMNTMGTYQSPTSLAANMSFMAGQQAENLVNRAIDPIEQANVNIYNQVAGQRAGIMNQAIANNAQNKFLRSQDRAVLNQQYINALNDADSGLTQAVNQGITNAAGIYNTNLVESPYYYYDPRTQKMKFHDENARAAYQAAMKNAGPGDGDIMARYLATRKELAGYFDNNKDLHDAVLDMMGMGKSSGSRSTTSYPFKPQLNKTTVQTPFPAYTNPMLMTQQGQQ